MYLGIDIGGTAVKMGLVTREGDIIATHHASVSNDSYVTPIVETVLREIDLFLCGEGIDSYKLEGIGVSATGQINTKTGVVIGTGGNIENWVNTPLKEILVKKYQLRVAVENDANCMIIGEAWRGVAQGVRQVIGITIGTGVGGGIVVEGRILNGKRGLAGEVGHFSIKCDGELCTCGNRGCYEQYASMSALVKTVKCQYDELDLLVGLDDINGAFIFAEVAKGHAQLTEIVNEWMAHIGAGLVSLVHLFNPELIVIGGGVCKQEELFIKPLRSFVNQHVMPQFRDGLTLKAATLGNDAGLLGAVANLLNEIE